MENTLENKARFFAQYFGQEVYMIKSYDGSRFGYLRMKLESVLLLEEHEYLELKPLSSISDEDAIDVFNILLDKDVNIKIDSRNKTSLWLLVDGDQDYYIVFELTGFECYCGDIQIKNDYNKIFKALDFLRSKGYALDWEGITIEEQIKRGWTKLKNV